MFTEQMLFVLFHIDLRIIAMTSDLSFIKKFG